MTVGNRLKRRLVSAVVGPKKRSDNFVFVAETLLQRFGAIERVILRKDAAEQKATRLEAAFNFSRRVDLGKREAKLGGVR
jgi:hypothetical protein